MEAVSKDPPKDQPLSKSAIVSPDWVYRWGIGKKNFKILDATWGLNKTDSEQDFEKEHIPNATFFDIDKVADKSVDLPHMLPPPDVFDQFMAAAGIENTDQVLVYDRSGMYVASARLWWTLKAFGHRNVVVLEGGLSNWKKFGYPVSSGKSTFTEPSAYRAKLNTSLVQTLEQMQQNIKDPKAQIVDARSAGRFKGIEPEPRKGLRGGHMPNSKNLPFGDLLTKSDKEDNFLKFKSVNDLKEEYKKVGIDVTRPVVTTCGSGVTASVLALGLHEIDPELKVSVYDGSWSEWGGLSPEVAPVISEAKQ